MRHGGRHRDANSFFHPGARPFLLDHKNGPVEEQSEKTNSCCNESLLPPFVVVDFRVSVAVLSVGATIHKDCDMSGHKQTERDIRSRASTFLELKVPLQ